MTEDDAGGRLKLLDKFWASDLPIWLVVTAIFKTLLCNVSL